MNSKMTQCPKCSHEFEIHKNRALKIRENTQVAWFIDAMNQFENFSEVICPNCKENYKAPEAKLFGIFKSPYTIVGISMVFIVILGIAVYLENAG